VHPATFSVEIENKAEQRNGNSALAAAPTERDSHYPIKAECQLTLFKKEFKQAAGHYLS